MRRYPVMMLALAGALAAPAPAEAQRRPRTPAPRQMIRDCADICPQMVVVPAGRFRMGTNVADQGFLRNDSPQRDVVIPRAFAAGRYEVTFDEYDACVTDGGCPPGPGDEGWGRGRRPAINVSWNDAQAYVRWLSRRTGRAYRLLTEAEWEYAARAGTTTRYAFGDTLAAGAANFGNSLRRTSPVGTYRPNAFGLYDMHGNVNEWVEDCFARGYAGAPSDGSASSAGDCTLRVLRGGSWYSEVGLVRSTSRDRTDPDSRNDFKGFRVARAL